MQGITTSACYGIGGCLYCGDLFARTFVFHQFYPLRELPFFYWCVFQPNKTTMLSLCGLFICYKIAQLRYNIN